MVEAHNGAVLCLRWNYDGSALVSGMTTEVNEK
jgi:hypothetical protein